MEQCQCSGQWCGANCPHSRTHTIGSLQFACRPCMRVQLLAILAVLVVVLVVRALCVNHYSSRIYNVPLVPFTSICGPGGGVRLPSGRVELSIELWCNCHSEALEQPASPFRYFDFHIEGTQTESNCKKLLAPRTDQLASIDGAIESCRGEFVRPWSVQRTAFKFYSLPHFCCCILCSATDRSLATVAAAAAFCPIGGVQRCVLVGAILI